MIRPRTASTEDEKDLISMIIPVPSLTTSVPEVLGGLGGAGAGFGGPSGWIIAVAVVGVLAGVARWTMRRPGRRRR